MATDFTPKTIAVVEQCIEMLDIENMVENAVCYVSVYHCTVMDYILENIDDSEEFTQEEIQYLSERVRGFMDKHL